jgi:hypothetical protein
MLMASLRRKPNGSAWWEADDRLVLKERVQRREAPVRPPSFSKIGDSVILYSRTGYVLEGKYTAYLPYHRPDKSSSGKFPFKRPP